MSELRDESLRSGYDTPIPELDDHRNQVPSSQRPDRSRRGTFDSLYAAAQLDSLAIDHLGRVQSRVAEDAVTDDEGESFPRLPSSRRPTADSVPTSGDRAESPPNSVKAFAQARRRDREVSTSEHLGDAGSVHSGRSACSEPSFISKHQATTHDLECGSLASNLTAEEDVCFPVQEEHRTGGPHIDFDILQTFILAQEKEEEINALERQASARSFPNLAQLQTTGVDESAIITADGDFLGPKLTMGEKTEKIDDSASCKSKDNRTTLAQQQPADPNRFSFFSSVWESTAHAATLGGLLFGGEDVRHLFSFPREEADGVWWLNVAFPEEEEVRTLCKAFSIHPLTVEDVITQEPREKIELFPSYYFASFRSFRIVEDDGEIEYEPFSIYVVVFREGTLSFTYAQNGHASHVRKRIAMLKDYVALSSDWICYALM